MTDDTTIGGHDVLDEKRHLDALAGRAFRFVEGEEPPMPIPTDFPPGLYEMVPLDQLAERTNHGWVIVAVMNRPRLMNVREDAVAPPEVGELTVAAARRVQERQRQSGHMHGSTPDLGPRIVSHHNGLPPEGGSLPAPEVGTVSLYKQIVVTEKVFLMRKETSSVIADAARVCDDAAKAMQLAQRGKEAALKERDDAIEKRTEAMIKVEQAERGAKYQATENDDLRKRLRAMEDSLATLRSEKNKLVAGIGQIKAKEILGE